MKNLEKQCSIDKFIFPDEKIHNKPNRFIAEIETDNIQEVGEYAKSFVIKEYETIACKLLSELNLPEPGGFKSQINDLLYVNWAALPLEKDNYAERYAEIEKYLGAIKNVRQFRQMEEEGRKCSLCGERNVLFYRGKKVQNNAISVNRLPPKYMMDGEGLCAVCFTKRSYGIKNGSYPSVAEISLMNSLDKLNSTLQNEYKGLFGDHFDEELYFESNLTEKYFKKYGYKAELESAKAHLKKIKNDAKNKNIGFSTYYAVILLDGDSMGKWLSGDEEYLKDKSQLMEFHRELTKRLSGFSEAVTGIIKKPKGELVYAGGDDALAFVNLNHLLPLIKEVIGKFPKFEEIHQVPIKKASSASCGICISHYKTPLSETLRWARTMEKEAKKIDGKNAFAIAVLKRSGEIRKTAFKWEYDRESTVQIMEELVQSLKQDEFSDTFIKNLSAEFGRFMTDGLLHEFKPLLETEMLRLIDRSCMMRKEENESREEFENRKKDRINELNRNLKQIYYNSRSFEDFISFLDIAVFIEREINKCE